MNNTIYKHCLTPFEGKLYCLINYNNIILPKNKILKVSET